MAPSGVVIDCASPAQNLPAAARADLPTGDGRAEAALRLLASTLDGNSLSVAAHNLVGQLAAGHRFTRVSLGFLRDGLATVVASSNLDSGATGAELLRLICAAMDETIEQGESALLPPSGSPGPPIMLAQRALQRHVGGSVATIPLASRGQALGALVVERSNGAITRDELEWLEHSLALVAPSLALLQRDERSWRARLRDDVRAAGQRRFGFSLRKRRWWAIAALVLLGIVPVGLQVGGRARVEGNEQRVLAAPTDGFLKVSQVRPGDVVHKGDPLAELIEHDLMLERTRWASQLTQHENAYAAAMARTDRTQVAVSAAKVSESQAQLALVDGQITRAVLVAPFDGVVIQGDLSQAIGAPVRQGDPLMTLASTEGYRIVVEIGETEIGRVHLGQLGSVALSALPWDNLPIRVDRITPLAHTVDGANVFDVHAQLLATDARVRPGLQGQAKLDIGRGPLLWRWSSQALTRLRVLSWSWLG